MLGTRKDVVESKNPQDLPIENFKKYLMEVIKNLKRQISDLGSDSKSIALVEKFILLINEKSALFDNQTYRSWDEIEKVFTTLIDNFKKECLAQGVAESHRLLVETFELLLDWFKIRAIEAFIIYRPLAYEMSGSEAKESKISLKEKFEMLTKRINNFNAFLAEHEQSLARSTIQLPDVSEDFSHFLQPLIKEETDPPKRFLLFYPLEKFKTERAALEKDTEELRVELEETINDFKRTFEKQEKERMELYDSQLDIDVYYLRDFAKENQAIREEYHKLFKKKDGKFERFKVISEWIDKMSVPYKAFRSSFSKSEAKNISGSWIVWWSHYYGVVNYIHAFLKTDLTALEESPTSIFKLEKQYSQEFGYIHNELHSIEKAALENFRKAAREYLQKISILKPEIVMALHREVIKAKDAEFERFIQSLQPSVLLPVIQPIRYDSIRRDILNRDWRRAFNILFENELKKISTKLTKIKQQNSTHRLEALNKLELDLVNLRQSIDDHIEKNGCYAVSSIVSDAFLAANNHKIMKEVHLYKHTLTNTEKPKEISFTEEKEHAVHADKSWKKLVLLGIVTFVLVALAFTGWGLAVEVSLSVILLSTLVLSPALGALTGFIAYIFQGCCSSPRGEVEKQALTEPSSRIKTQPSIVFSLDELKPSPSSLRPVSLDDHKHAISTPKQATVVKKDDAGMMGAWGFLGRYLTRQVVEDRVAEKESKYKL